MNYDNSDKDIKDMTDTLPPTLPGSRLWQSLCLALALATAPVYAPVYAQDTAQNPAQEQPLDPDQVTPTEAADLIESVDGIEPAEIALPGLPSPPSGPLDGPLDIDSLYIPVESLPVHGRTAARLAEILQRVHYRPVAIDDGFSSQVFDDYIESLDSQRMHFLQGELQRLDDYRYTLDDSLRAASVEPGFAIYNQYHRRRLQRLIYAIERVENHVPEMDFTLEESYSLRDELPYPGSMAELQEVWRQWVKSAALGLKLAGDDDGEIKEKLSRRFRNQLSNALKINERDVFQRYMSAVAGVADPHTDYFSPRNAENFNMSMSLSLQGIGAQLGLEDEYTRVMAIIPGGPAERAGELQVGDRITGVAQGGEGEFVDVVGMRLDDVVAQIRGEKGSLVRLRLIPADAIDESVSAVISITRDVVKLEDQAAAKEIIEFSHAGHDYRVGVIDLPLFYFDFVRAGNEARDFNSSVRDVRALLEELQAEGVDGVIMDLRDNSGGSLSEANDMVGLFIETGPTVQIRDSGRRSGRDIIRPLHDREREVVYAGPLAVLVNRASASSSEIFAGAIQDYQRGLVLGGQTYGKGTVQELMGMDYGQLKITRSQFYRISGASTQSRGVMPDILLPDIHSANEQIGESNLDNALPWDEIRSLEYPMYLPLQALLPELMARHQARAETLPDFIYLNDLIERNRQQQAQQEFSLNEATVKAERRARRRAEFDADNVRREAKGLSLREWVENEAGEAGEAGEADETSEDSETAESSGADVASVTADEPEESSEQEMAAETEAAAETGEADVAAAEETETEEPEETDPLLLETGRVLADYILLTGGPATPLTGHAQEPLRVLR